MRIWWFIDFKAKISDKKYLRIIYTYFFIITLITIIIWPSKSFDINKYSITDLFLIFALAHFIFITYFSSLTFSGNLIAEREFKIINLARFSPFRIREIVWGRFLANLFYFIFILLILFPFNLMISFSVDISKIIILYLLLLLDSLPIMGLGILWSTFSNPSINWLLHWITYILFIIFPFLFPSTFFLFPLNNILWLIRAESILYLKVNFHPSKDLPIITIFYLIIFLISILIAEKRLKYYQGVDKR
jgi:hypothetical protein